MHTCGCLFSNSSTAVLIYLDAINTVFNTGVSIFVLISGYFSINFKARKLFSFWSQVLFCSLISWFITSLIHDSFSINGLLRSCLPILTNKYWFATSYVVLMLFAPILNIAVEKLSKQCLVKIIISFFIVFSILPTFFYFGIPGSNKGILQFFLMYLIGRYIASYMPVKSCNRRRIIWIAFFTFLLIYTLNLFATFLYRKYVNETGVVFLLSRDCSFFIIIASVLIFLLFRSFSIKSTLINSIASHVFCIYLMEGAYREVFRMFINIEDYANTLIFPFALICFVLLVIVASSLTDVFRRIVLTHVEKKIWHLLERSYRRFVSS